MITKAYSALGVVLTFVGCGVCLAEGSDKLAVGGQVVDYLARPVEGAEVVIYQREYRDGDYFAKANPPIAKTDREGRFELQAEMTSQYDAFIVARKAGLALAWDGLNYSSNSLGKGHFLLVLEKPHTLSGVVVDYGGKPVAKAKVQAVPKTSYMQRLNQRPMYGPPEWFTTETDREGVFRFDAFSDDVGSDFRVQAPGWNCTYTFTTHYQNCCGFQIGRSDIRLMLPQERRVRGRVTDAATGEGVAGVKLAIKAELDREDILNRYLAQTVVTGTDGTFICAGLPEGKSTIALASVEDETPLWVAQPAVVDVAANQAAEDVRVTVSKGGMIEADVREQDTNRLLSGIRVRAYGDSGSANSVTNDSGRATFRILPGEYEAYASDKAYLTWRVNQPVVVTEGQVTHLDISLDPHPTIEGTVTDEDGHPAGDVLVTVHPSGDDIYTDAKGHFAAHYEARNADQGLCLMARDRARSLAAVVRTTELREPVQLSLRSALTVTGRVTDPNGKGIPAARASLSVTLWNFLCGIGEEVLTDPEGRFELKAIPPVQEHFDYRISLHAGDYAPKTYKRITIEGKPGSTADVGAIELLPADMSIGGVVVDANGVPAPRVILFIQGAEGIEQPDKATATDERGRFRVTRLCRGPIRVQVNFANSPAGSGHLRAEAGDQDLKAILGQDVVHERFVALTGKPLPDLSEMCAFPNETDADGKAILVCFWDMQQRPSRRALTQLAQKAATLQERAVTVLAVETSGAGREQFDEWTRQYNVPFVIGILNGRFDEKKLTWGVKSLPWLVFTDKEHVVTAEGFALDELEAHVKRMTGD